MTDFWWWRKLQLKSKESVIMRRTAQLCGIKPAAHENKAYLCFQLHYFDICLKEKHTVFQLNDSLLFLWLSCFCFLESNRASWQVDKAASLTFSAWTSFLPSFDLTVCLVWDINQSLLRTWRYSSSQVVAWSGPWFDQICLLHSKPSTSNTLVGKPPEPLSAHLSSCIRVNKLCYTF